MQYLFNMRKTYAEINLDHLKENFINIRKKTGTKVLAVVKADAYGHGMIECVRALKTLGDKAPEYYAVAIPDEAMEFRRQFPDEKILVFAPLCEDEIEEYTAGNIIATVSGYEHIEMLKSLPKDVCLKVHIKADTGMGRIGLSAEETAAFAAELQKLENVEIDGIYTHFATSDEYDKSYANHQFKRFLSLLEELKRNNINYGVAHAANSGAILDMPEAYLDMVRPGIILYGYYPSHETSESLELKPVMSLWSVVTTVKTMKSGDSVSYGRRFTLERDSRIASVPIGYADGFLRGLTNKSKGIINGRMFNQVGQVCMDRIMFEIGDENVHEGDRIILIGEDSGNVITAWDWSDALNTIPYEITCGISKRVPRIYVG